MHSHNPPSTDGAPTAAHDDTFAAAFDAICTNVERAIRGKRPVIELVVMSLLADGHVLVEDAPGVGKTTLAKGLARSISSTFGRLQFTPDLLPADVVGVNVWNRDRAVFDFRPGPVFSNIVLADEINRASPKTQSALLEAMGERQVTIDGETKALDQPFMVVATQNPYEHEGTYPLPESQLDRFIVKLSVGYPNPAIESEILHSHGTDDPVATLRPVIDVDGVRRMRRVLDGVHIAGALRDYIVALATATRSHPALTLGASPRALLSLQRLCQARAAAGLRDYATPDDVRALAGPALAHRIVVAPESRARGVTALQVLDEILRSVPVPAAAG